MISAFVSVLAATATIAGPGAQPSRPVAASGLISTSQMAVRATVVDRCAVSPAGAACQGAAPIKPLPVGRPSPTRIDIVF